MPDEIIGSELFPDGGGAYAVAKDWLYAFPNGVTSPVNRQISVPGCTGAAIVNTSWHYLVFPVNTAGLQMRDPADDLSIVTERKVPFDVHVFIPFTGNLILAMNSDGRFMMLDVTNEINVTDHGRLEDCLNVNGGYSSGTTVYITCADYGVREYTFEDGDREVYDITLVNSTELRSVQDLKDFADGQFASSLDPEGDTQLSIQLPRYTSTRSRWGLAVAHGDTGRLSIADAGDTLPVGLREPTMPEPNIRYSFRDQGGEINFVDNEGTSTGTTGVLIDGDTQIIDPFVLARASAPGDQVVLTPFGGFPIPGGLYIETSLAHNGVGVNSCDVLTLGTPEFVRISIDSTLNTWSAFIDTNPATVQNTPPIPYSGNDGTDYNKLYHQIFVNFKADSVDIWIDGVLFTSDTTLTGSIDTSVFDIFTNIVSGGNQYLSLSDVRLYTDIEITDQQAAIFSGGSLEI